MNKSWILALVTGVLASVFYVGNYYGISVFIMTVLCVATMYYYRKEAGVPIGKRFYLVGGYMLLLSPVFAVTTVTVVRFWSGVFLLSLLLCLAITEREFRWPDWLKSALGSFFGAISKAHCFFTHGKKEGGRHRKILLQVGLGLVIAVPILLMAAGLLASADQVMDQMLTDFFDLFEFEDLGVWIRRFLMLTFTTTVTFGYSYWLKREKDEAAGETLVKKEVEVVPPAVSGTVLVLLNILYLVFAYIQIRFLFFGAQAHVDGGYNYADYARSGFFELVTLSVMNTIGILLINRFTKVHLFNSISLSVTVFCTFIMMASSAYKMRLYEQAYGYTQLRLYVYFILAYMVVFIALIFLGIWKRHYRVIEWSIVIGLVNFLLLSYVNVDAIIVNNNVTRYEKTGEMDMHHLLWELTEDGVPAVMNAVAAHPELIEDRLLYDDLEDYMHHHGRGEYFQSRRNNEADEETRWFFEFNLRHTLAQKAIKENVGLIDGW